MTDVTVAISCFNLGAYLPEAVTSAREQGAAVIVVDDGSTDPATHRALQQLPGDVRVVRQANAGAAAARNAGLRAAETPYVLALDADDRLAPGAVAAMRIVLESHPTLGFAYGSMRFFGAWHGVLRMPPYSAYRLLHRHTIGLSALMRRQVVEDTGGFDPEFAHFEDWELWVHALAHGWRGQKVEAVTLEYRRRAGSKHGEDRRHYREAYRRLRGKHAGLYRRAGELAAEERVGLLERGLYRWFWGARPVPARLEAAVHGRLFGRRDLPAGP